MYFLVPESYTIRVVHQINSRCLAFYLRYRHLQNENGIEIPFRCSIFAFLERNIA